MSPNTTPSAPTTSATEDPRVWSLVISSVFPSTGNSRIDARIVLFLEQGRPEDPPRMSACVRRGARRTPRPQVMVNRSSPSSGRNTMALILWIIAVILVISGIVTLFRGQILFGILLIVVGLLVGPGGVSIFT